MLCPILAFVDMVCAFPDSCRYHVQGVAEWCVYLSVCVCVCARKAGPDGETGNQSLGFVHSRRPAGLRLALLHMKLEQSGVL